MENMQFRTYRFLHNPADVTVRSSGRVVSHFCPGKGEITQELGGELRVITCRGAFFAKSYASALAQLEGFRAATTKRAAGLLFIPGLAPVMAHLRELVFEASGDGSVLPYTMVFVEEASA